MAPGPTILPGSTSRNAVVVPEPVQQRSDHEVRCRGPLVSPYGQTCPTPNPARLTRFQRRQRALVRDPQVGAPLPMRHRRRHRPRSPYRRVHPQEQHDPTPRGLRLAVASRHARVRPDPQIEPELSERIGMGQARQGRSDRLFRGRSRGGIGENGARSSRGPSASKRQSGAAGEAPLARRVWGGVCHRHLRGAWRFAHLCGSAEPTC